ncbi:hypothetical protein KASHIRA_01900 [Serratia phage vB_SmaM-Kashira]|nr:hypothetical protein KASHIRA_01900 [Serratia phage vB_SmaM-Kashira]
MSIELATDRESLVVCQTFKSGNTQVVTLVGKEQLLRLRDAIDEALGEVREPAMRLPHGSLWIWRYHARDESPRDQTAPQDILGGDILDPTPSKTGGIPEKGVPQNGEADREGTILREHGLYDATPKSLFGLNSWTKYRDPFMGMGTGKEGDK